MNEVESTSAGSTRFSSTLGGPEKYGMLLMGIFLMILSGGRFVTPSAAFLAAVFILMFTRNTQVKTGMTILYVLLFLSLLVRLHDYIDVPRPLNFLLIAGFALLELVPFVVDRKLFNKLPAAISPLVLPCLFVVISFVTSSVLPFGSMAEKAYTQVGNYELMQLLSVTGTHGVTFVMFWFAATMASLWDSGFVWRRCRSQVIPLSVCLMIIFVSGGFRNIFDENESPTVRIAGVVGDQRALLQSLRAAGVSNGLSGLSVPGYSEDQVTEALRAHHDDLFLRTRIEAQAGARIVSWAEGNGVVFKRAEAALLKRAADSASNSGVYLVVSVAVFAEPDNSPEGSTDTLSSVGEPVENKLLVFGPNGDLLGQYIKARSLWSDRYVEGDGEPLLIDTEFGKVAFAIGFDLDFPASMRKTGEADILIAPSSDWKTLSPHHSLMATFRGVENGLSLFRPVNNGLSIASDSHGRIIAQADQFRTMPHTLIANVPTRGVKTIYTNYGDWFAWFNCLLFLLLMVVSVTAWRRRNKRRHATGSRPREDDRDKSRITAIQWRDSERDNNL